MNIAKYINDLLLKHNCVIVPGLGGFIINYKPASINPINHTFTPPSNEIVFNSALKNNDGILINYIAAKYKISYTSATELTEIAINNLIKQLINDKKIFLDDLGHLSIDNKGNISFEPDKKFFFSVASFGLEEFTSPPVSRPGIKEQINDKIRKEKAKPEKIKKLNSNLRWAAAASVSIVAIITWASFNMDHIKHYTSNNSNILSFLFHYKNMTENNENSVKYKIGNSKMIYVLDFDKLIPEKKEETLLNIPFIKSPINNQINTSNDKEITINEQINTIENTIDKKYYIIGNCFKSKLNADLYLEDLKKKGFKSASMAGISSTGLYRVSFASYNSQTEAQNALAEIKNNYNKNAWLFEN